MVKTLVRRSAFFLSLVGLFCMSQLPAQTSTVTELSKRLERHGIDLEAVKLADSPYLMHFLFVGTLFEGSKGPDDLNPGAVEAEKALLAATIKEGITPIGAMKVWTFPEFAGAQRYGDGHSEWFTTLVFIPQCVPEFQNPEYARLRAIRSQMFATVARTFSEIPGWLIGPEPEPKFFDCDGTESSLEDHLRFVVDTLEDLSTAIKSVNSSASIVGHFLGDRWHLLKINGQQLQPSEMLALIQEEIRSRGKPTELYYDLFVHELDPIFLADRFEEEPVPMGFGGSALSGGCTDCWGDPVWEHFNTNADDLVDEYDAWIDLRTDYDLVLLTEIEVTGGEAVLRLEDWDPQSTDDTSAAGARSEPTEIDFVPNESFGTSADGQAKNLWTAVSDFYPTDEPTSSPGAHPAICTRVERTWSAEEDQTRFCSIVPSLEVTRTGFDCSNGGGTTEEKIGAAQFTGDANSGGTTGFTYLSCFNINTLVYYNPGDLHRVEIQEEERRGCVFCSYIRYWKADVYNLDGESLLGSSGWVSEFVFTSTPVYSIPSLSEQILFAYAPGIDGGIDVERVGTTYWIYAE